MLDAATLDLLALVAGLSQDSGSGFLTVLLVDCTEAATEGATLSLTPSVGQIIYADAAGTPDASLTTTSASGVAFVFNATPGPVLVSATRDGSPFRSVEVEAIAATVTAAILAPNSARAPAAVPLLTPGVQLGLAALLLASVLASLRRGRQHDQGRRTR
jgi:hypothetical protein